MAQVTQLPIEYYCAIGDNVVARIPYDTMVYYADKYIKSQGGFEKFAEWGLIGSVISDDIRAGILSIIEEYELDNE